MPLFHRRFAADPFRLFLLSGRKGGFVVKIPLHQKYRAATGTGSLGWERQDIADIFGRHRLIKVQIRQILCIPGSIISIFHRDLRKDFRTKGIPIGKVIGLDFLILHQKPEGELGHLLGQPTHLAQFLKSHGLGFARVTDASQPGQGIGHIIIPGK